MNRRSILMAPLIVPLVTLAAPAVRAAGESGDGARWAEIRRELFGDRPIEPAGDRLVLEAPGRAEDAAVVPVSFTATAPRRSPDGVRSVHLIIDNNPAPLAAVFRFPPDGADPAVATRIRINEYTPLRAVAETADGRLIMAERFVKASGGCSAPAGKDQVAALARLGRMRLNGADAAAPGRPATLQVLISHPNNSGLQFDQISRTYVPPHYLTTIAIAHAGRPLLAVDADISLSEDPSIHFTFVPDGPGPLTVRAEDTKGGVFDGAWPVAGAPGG
ncbi:quinoprotein dehydrogenase-associated SoxYZ-like carrier [Azospirillum halopraeferens]|uniref:quinoprotein dehydrogenase-associated SoxYZ-like carrier n=1 Tax=Azospirillum halopraeferens TaxID=34010 RepID=UPI00041FE3DA|nr:quinoprotein dehydrogenase-associated SoxYZ-like carrier [Azospirillum halopraeferens]